MENTDLQIGLVLPYLKRRGTEKQALRLSEGFIKKGAEVVLFVTQGWGLKNMYLSFEKIGAEIVNVGPPADKGSKSVQTRRAFKLGILARKKCNILLSRAAMTNNITAIAGVIAHLPTALVLSGMIPEKPATTLAIRGWLKTLRYVGLYAFANRIITISKTGARKFKAFYHSLADRVVGIQNGIDIPGTEASKKRDKSLIDEKRFNIVYSGSLDIHRKGIDLLIEALNILIFEYGCKDVSLVIIGSGKDETMLKHLVQTSGLKKFVTFAGERKDPLSVVAFCDVFVMPSRWEGFGSMLIEAMSVGICSIAADCEIGPGEVIEHGLNGLLVPVGDSRSLAKAVKRVIEDESLRMRLAKNGRKTVEKHFSAQRMVDEYYKVLSDISM